MGREVRMVPLNWEHPTDDEGKYIPLLKQTRDQWREAKRQWDAGFVSDYNGGWEPKTTESWFQGPYRCYAGPLGGKNERMPDFKLGTATHLCMYEDCTEGTPISPVFATPEELARWLADSGASSCGSMTATYEQWLATIKQGSALSMIYSPSTGLISGVQAAKEKR